AFRHKLDPDKHTFDFIDAPFESGPAAGVDVFFTRPYFTFYRATEVKDIRAAHVWLRELIDRQGPYDAVMCFSQGCSVISSLILYHQKECPEEPLPFKAAIFICGGVPLPVLSDLGLPVPPEVWAMNERSGRELAGAAGSARAKVDAITSGGRSAHEGLWDRPGIAKNAALIQPPTDRTNIYGLDFTQFPDNIQMKIPTIHIYGSKDPRYPNSMHLVHFSQEEHRKMYDHGGGHEIPRTAATSDMIAVLVDWLEGLVMK
ncbi:MAG: hypothetical protein MMC33_003166, partial [Icmadophila ericetorum]|nr:hypothetical protein [Icmadophila ericetorum]